MKTLVCKGPGELEYQTVKLPALTRNHAIVKIKRIGVCGTDLHAFDGTQPYFTYPRILGHELAGELVDIDETGSSFHKGDIVSIIPYFSCGTCIACRNGKTNCCVKMQVCGVHVDGGMVEYLSVPTTSLVYGRGLGLDELALIEPLAIGAHGVRRADVTRHEFVLVVGAGPIGLAAMEFSRLAGANVIALDVNEQRLHFCHDKLGIEHTVNAHAGNIHEQLNDITGGDMPAVVIDATGNRDAINDAFQYMAHGGRYILIGLQKGEITFNHPEFHKREGTLMSSRNATRADFDHVVSAIEHKHINPANYITHRVRFDQAKTEFANFANPANRVIKAIIEFTDTKSAA